MSTGFFILILYETINEMVTPMRQYIRHPTDIPLEYRLVEAVVHDTKYLRDISEGGLSFLSAVCLGAGAKIHIRIPLREPVFETDGIVVWCRDSDNEYEVGVQFVDPASEYRVRMVEQVAHIEHYKMEVLKNEGRQLTGAEAAKEWIARYARDFPS